MKRSTFLLISILILAILSVFFVYPGFSSPFDFLSKRLPWQLGLDLIGGAQLIYEVDMSQVSAADRDSVMAGLRDTIEKRINLFGVSEPQVVSAKEGDSHRLMIELAGYKDIAKAIKEIGETPLLDFRQVTEIEIEGKNQAVYSPTQLTGRYIKGAQIDFDPTTNNPRINIQFNDEGAKIFEELTAQNINKPLGIFLDNNLIEEPVVREKISGGNAQISGQFTPEEAKKLVARFNAGALPAPINLVSQQLVGASLGEESLNKAVYSGLIGTLVIMAFMLVYYRTFGLFASFALLIYIALTLAVFKGVSMTMTLSGIAGFILSIGMAVDANILIFERTKEEIKKGVSKISAIEEGFRRAWPSIRDSNASTIITAVILYFFTSSFVKGFALSLLIGVLVSMFSAITITRTLLLVFLKNKSNNK
ncbi:protein-export membrane protein SecD [Candidatus Wolfebacteria bacterium RIFCSPLOWO2_01_FULL_38_11]|uniref:Protein translocase subunit SecD n=1 Tax=Candidatus Wolfebacteria bacterium RIFCSPLOWO2_01_FULL_38_11 TaxID=1802556 RepID=A0A1F8DPX4_9BACT|nr:MAG: protein-export membrane protein SecD [Candidatus Wolfebacteria bacterium RIFCSPLOWO2_01_FULL_38_11]